MKWLHLSDFHFTTHPNTTTIELLEQLPEFLKKNVKPFMAREEKASRHLFFTGDFRTAFSPTPSRNKEDSENSLFVLLKKIIVKNNNAFLGSIPSVDRETEAVENIVAYILYLADCVDIPHENIHLVAGNHDIERCEKKKRKKIARNYDPYYSELALDTFEDVIQSSRFFLKIQKLLETKNVEDIWSGNWNPDFIKKFADKINYCNFYDEFTLLYINSFYAHYIGDKKDLYQLDIDKIQLAIHEIKERSPKNPVFVLAHDPISHFETQSKTLLLDLLHSIPVAFYLCGDEHKHSAVRINNYLELTMGALNYHPKTDSVFSSGEMHSNHYCINTYFWSDNPLAWGDFNQFNDKIQELIGVAAHYGVEKLTKATISFQETAFVGREKDLEAIPQLLNEQKKVTLTSLVGGVGKTELCRKLYHNYLNDNSCISVKKIAWITYQGTLKQSIYQKFCRIEESLTTERYEEFVFKLLSCEDCLLILDNANNVNQTEMERLLELPCKILFTSRNELPFTVKEYFLDELDEEQCVLLYKNNLISSRRHRAMLPMAEDHAVREIVKLANYHTLTITLLAKIQLAQHKTAHDLSKSLAASGFDLSGLNELIKSEYNIDEAKKDVSNRRIIEHLCEVFKLTDIEKNPEEMRILSLFSLLKPNTIFPENKLDECLGVNDWNDVNQLINKSWLLSHYGNEEYEKGISIHPVVAEVVRKNNKIEEDYLHPFLSWVANELSYDTIHSFKPKLYLLPHVNAIISFIEKYYDLGSENTNPLILENISKIYGRSARIFNELGRYKEATEYIGNALGLLDSLKKPAIEDIISFLRYKGNILLFQQEYEEAYLVLSRSHRLHNQILEDVLNTNDIPFSQKEEYDIVDLQTMYSLYQKNQDSNSTGSKEWLHLATFCNTLANLFNIVSQSKTVNVEFQQSDQFSQKAESYFDLALEIFNDQYGEDNACSGKIYNNLSSMYLYQEDFEKALSTNDLSLKIREKIYGEKDEMVANTLHTRGRILEYGASQEQDNTKLEKIERARICYEKAKEIRTVLLGVEHELIAVLHRDLGNLEESVGRYEEALFNYQHSYEINCKRWGHDHSHSVNALSNCERVQAYLVTTV